MQQPAQGVPGGCLIGTLSLMAAGVSGLGFWGLIKWMELPVSKRQLDSNFWILVAAAALGGLLSLLIGRAATKVLRRTDFRGYDSRDPGRKNLKW